MRRLLPLALLALAGCGKERTPDAQVGTVAAPKADPAAARREADAQAAFNLDAAGASIKQAFDAAKALAPVAGGDAKEALLDVAEMLDSAGATLAEHDDPPPPLEEYRRAEPTEARQKAVTDALDALHELRDAGGTLDDLAQNAPEAHAKALDAIQTDVDEAQTAVEEAITRLGGKVPPEDEGDGGQSSNDRS